MKIICTPRRTGKTTKLIEACAEQGGYIVCSSEREARDIARRAKDMGHNIPFPVTSFEVVNGKTLGKRIELLHVDNAEFVLQDLLRVRLGTITMSDYENSPGFERVGEAVIE